MPAIHFPAANQILADRGGTLDKPAAPPTADAASPTDIIDSIFGDSLANVLSGGSHPESVRLPVAQPLEKATDSIEGRFGGLVPKAGSVVGPGPAGMIASARHRAQAVLERLSNGG
jgi:hypothetical protein